MPYYKSRRYSRKPRYGRKKYSRYASTIRPYLRRRGMGDRGLRFFKLRQVVTISSSAAGIIDSGTSFNNDPSAAQDWSSLSSLFDTYKVSAMKVKYQPVAPNDEVATRVNNPIYVIADCDNPTTPITSANIAIQYENCKMMNSVKPWTYYYKYPKQTSSANNLVILSGGYRDIAVTTASAGIYAWGNGLSASVTYGIAIITYYISCKNRR